MTEEKVKLAAKLYRCRDTAKRFFGDEYHERIDPYKKVISDFSQEKKIGDLEAMMKICEQDLIRDNGWALILLMAASVELIEPTKRELSL